MKLSNLCKKVLSFIEKDENKWEQWIEQKELCDISQSTCIQSFVELIEEAKDNDTKIMVAGDYDCDGIMATTIMVDGLKKYGLDCGFYIPNRLKEGYGLHSHIVELAYKKGYKMIITVDNGVKAFDALERADELGIQVIVTDHHTVDEFVPCELLVHPNEMEEEFSSLCGAGVAYECIRALKVDTPFHLMCACVASIGDVMKVTGQTRWIIQKGMQALNRSQDPHFFFLSNDKTLNETSIAFQIVPKLNALGRLSNIANANNAVRYFLADEGIQSFAQQIDSVNTKRKEISQSMLQNADQRCDVRNDILFVYDKNYHEGIVGLVSGSLCAKYDKPVIIATSCDGTCRCSMRAPNGFNCMDFLQDFMYFETMGGHSQAAGFSFLDENISLFEEYIKDRIQTYIWTKEDKMCLSVCSSELSLSEVKSLDLLRPFGPGFELPTFEIIEPDVKSIFDFQNGKHRKYVLDDGLTCMNFNQSIENMRSKGKMISSLEGSISISQYQQRESVNFTIEKIKYLKTL